MMQDKSSRGPASGGPRKAGIQAIARAGQVLRALQAAPEGAGLVELAQAVALPKSTVHRLVGALAAEGLAATAADGRIVLGAGLLPLAAATRRTLPQQLRPVLVQLRRSLDETVDLAVLDGAAVRFVDQLAAPHRLRAVSAVGTSFPLYCTANGKALLAAMAVQDARALLPARLARMTAATITSRRALLDELAEVRRRGVAFDREEHTEGICAVGAAVFDAVGCAAALSVPVPAPRFRGHADRYAEAVSAAAREASAVLGG